MFQWQLPATVPNTTNELYAYLCTVTEPTVDDFRLMLLVEVIGEKIYDEFAQGTENVAVKALLRKNGREELGHAHRLSKVVEILSGEPFPVPSFEENPVIHPSGAIVPITAELLQQFADIEFGGGDLYGGWADRCGNAEAAALLRQNGKEESNHARRLQQAADLLQA